MLKGNGKEKERLTADYQQAFSFSKIIILFQILLTIYSLQFISSYIFFYFFFLILQIHYRFLYCLENLEKKKGENKKDISSGNDWWLVWIPIIWTLNERKRRKEGSNLSRLNVNILLTVH